MNQGQSTSTQRVQINNPIISFCYSIGTIIQTCWFKTGTYWVMEPS